MTRARNARLAGFTFLFYIVAGICGMVAFNVATRGGTTAARLVSIVPHPSYMSLSFICAMLTILCAIVLAVTLYALTREEDADVARLATSCRLLEAAINGFPALASLALISIASGPAAQEAATNGIASVLLKVRAWSTPTSATMFAVGSAIYCALFLRGRLIPRWMAKLGLIASILLIVAEPLDAVGAIKGFISGIVWLPMVAFEVPFGIWLLITGADTRRAPIAR